MTSPYAILHRPVSVGYVLANLDETNPDCASLNASIARGRRLRVEIYIDYGNWDRNKACFDHLFSKKEYVAQIVGEPLAWERLDHKRASRIAVYTRARVSLQFEDDRLIDWGSKTSRRDLCCL